jgi:hypothetical protein
MTEDTPPDPQKAGALAQKIVSILTDQNSATRRLAMEAAMTLLGEKSSGSIAAPVKRESLDSGGHAGTSFVEFFNRDETLKPGENAHLCAAYHYSLYGAVAFSLEDIRTMAKGAGVILPDRLDMTFQQAAKGGKKLFQSAGRGAFKPTAAAGIVFNERWNVRPGTRMKP